MIKPSLMFIVSTLLTVVAISLFTQQSLNQSFDSRTEATSSTVSWGLLRSATFDGGTFSEWDQVNAADGTISLVNEGQEIPPTSTPSNVKVAKAHQYASNTTDGHYSRAIWNILNWTDQTYRTEAIFYLPQGFYNSMEGAVQVMGWDTYPVLNNQMRLIIFNSDRKARLFINEDNVKRELTGTFSIPEGQWVKIAIEQKIHADQGWSRVYLNDELVASGNAESCPTNALACNDTLGSGPVTRMRYGLVAIADRIQSKPLTIYFDDVKLSVGTEMNTSPSPNPSSVPTINPSPSAVPSPITTPSSNTAPGIETGNLPDGRVGRSYNTKIVGYDVDAADGLVMTASGLPEGITLQSCSTYYNKKKSRYEISCQLRGTAASSGEYSPEIVLKDNHETTNSRQYRLRIR